MRVLPNKSVGLTGLRPSVSWRQADNGDRVCLMRVCSSTPSRQRHESTSCQRSVMTMTIFLRGGSLDVRAATQDDRDVILEVYRQCEDFLALGPQPNATMAMVLEDLEASRQRGAFFCGVHDAAGTMVGVVEFAPGGSGGKPGVAFISLLMLVPRVRGRGVGTEVLRLIEREIQKDPRVRAIGSAVQVNNPDAQRFWLRHGYRITGEPELRPDGTTVLHLHKDCGQVS